MRILFAVHWFPPHGKGGTEIYASQLLLELSRSHEVLVFFSDRNAFRPDYEVSSGKWEGIRYYSVNHTFKGLRDYRHTYQNSRIEEIFSEVLSDFKPDIVHFHHLTALSTGLPETARKAGVRAVVLTVHDLWLACAQGQMMRKDLKRCETVDASVCAACQINQLEVPRRAQLWPRILQKFFIQRTVRRQARGFLDFIWGLHESLIRRSFGSAVRQILSRQQAVESMLEHVDQCLLLSQALYQEMLEAGFPKEKMLRVPRGVCALPGVRKRIPDGVTRIGFLGTLIPSKGPQILIEAFKKIRNPRVELELYGPFASYAGFPGFESLIRREVKKTPRIRLCGAYERSELPAIFSRLDLTVVPSLWIENCPIVIEEALQAGLPVAASDLGSIREQVRHGENGLLFEADNADDLARVLELFLDNPAVVRSPGFGGRRVKTMAEDAAFHLSLYQRLLAGLPSSSAPFA